MSENEVQSTSNATELNIDEIKQVVQNVQNLTQDLENNLNPEVDIGDI
jgi:ABC-type dipeptide/oligopeptide/nickel transport system ATPase subunit